MKWQMIQIKCETESRYFKRAGREEKKKISEEKWILAVLNQENENLTNNKYQHKIQKSNTYSSYTYILLIFIDINCNNNKKSYLKNTVCKTNVTTSSKQRRINHIQNRYELHIHRHFRILHKKVYRVIINRQRSRRKENQRIYSRNKREKRKEIDAYPMKPLLSN